VWMLLSTHYTTRLERSVQLVFVVATKLGWFWDSAFVEGKDSAIGPG